MKPLFQPTKPFNVGQKFGESLACTEDRPGVPFSLRKTTGKVGGVCPVGYVDLYPLLGMKGHTGIDCYGPTGWPCFASREGFVHEVQTEPERGLGVGVITNEKFLCNETGQYEHFKYRCWHFMSTKVVLGQQVKIGTLLGLCDNTGLSAGSHLHYEIKPVRKNSQGVWYNVLQDNGYFGAVDPVPYINNQFALDAAGIIRTIAEALAKISEKMALLLRQYI